MIEILQPGFRTGAVHIPASKSQAHRLLICAALLSFKVRQRSAHYCGQVILVPRTQFNQTVLLFK